MSIFRHKLSLSFSLRCFLICQLIILKLCFATSVDSIVRNGQPVASSSSSSTSETLEFSDSIPGFEHHEFQSLRIKPLTADKLTTTNKSIVTKVTTSATLAASLLKKIGLPSTAKYASSDDNPVTPSFNKTILNSVLIKRINRQQPTTAALTVSSLITTPIPFDDTEIFKKQQIHKLPATNKLLRISKKKKAKQSTFKSLNSSSLLPSVTSPATNDIEDPTNNELTSSSLSPSGVLATEQHSVLINHGGGAVSTIRRTLNSGPSFEHLQIGFPPSNNFPNEPFSNFGLNVDMTPPPLPPPPPINNEPHQPSGQQKPPKVIHRDAQLPPIIQQQPPITKPIYSSNRNNGRLRGAHKKQVHVNRRKSAALVKDNELNNQIVPVSVGLPNTFQNVKPADLPNFAELSFFGYRSEQNAPRTFNEREHYTTNNNNNNLNDYNHENNNYNNLPPPPPPPAQPPINNNHQMPPPLNGSPRNEFNFNLHPFFANERRNQPPNNNDFYQFFDTPFVPINPPHNIHNNLNNIHYHHQTMHHHNGDNHQLNHQINHQIYHHQPMDNEIGNGPLHPINAPNGQLNFQRRKLTLSNGNTAPALNEISNNNLGYGYPSYNVYKGDEDTGMKYPNQKYPSIFKFTDGRVNLNDFEKEKKLGKIEFGKSVAEDGNEYTFEHVRRDLFLILHGGSFNY